MKRNFLSLLPLFGLMFSLCNIVSPAPVPVSTETPTEENTAPIPGDLGFGKITGKVTDGATGAPIAGATVKCEHFSYTTREEDRCHQTTTTDQKGEFVFENVFFHDTDTITLAVEAAGYESFSEKYAQFTQPVLKANIRLSQ